MISLNYIENPFDDDMMYSFECFRFEKTFYDILKRKAFDHSYAFLNLGYTFHMYLIVGDCNEWLGYILFHNSDIVNDHLEFIRQELKKLLYNLNEIETNHLALEQIHVMDAKLKNYVYETTMSLPILQQDLDLLRNYCINNSYLIDEYYESVYSFFDSYPEYYYVDLVIALPLDVDKRTIENNNYTFISEVNNSLKKLVKDHFSTVPILFVDSNSDVRLFDDSKEDIKILNKVKIKHNIK